jgi:hypothetical protein
MHFCILEMITEGDLRKALPYVQDPMVVVEMDANSLWDAIEHCLSGYPNTEG